jgi:hypothetical protein
VITTDQLVPAVAGVVLPNIEAESAGAAAVPRSTDDPRSSFLAVGPEGITGRLVRGTARSPADAAAIAASAFIGGVFRAHAVAPEPIARIRQHSRLRR